MNDFMGLVWLVVLLAGNAFFVAGEFAVMSARRSQIEPLADEGNKRAKVALYAMEHVSIMLAVCQLGITVCSLLILNISEPAIHHLLAEPLMKIGMAESAADSVAFLIALILVTFLHVTFGEMVPKNISVSIADKAVLLLAMPLVGLSKVLKPITASLNGLANLVLHAFGIEPKDEVASSYTAAEVRSIIDTSSEEGALDEDDAARLTKALEFSSVTARSCMVPLDDLFTLEYGQTTAREFEKKVGKTGFSRMVITKNDVPVGYWHVKDVMLIDDAHSTQPLLDLPLHPLGRLEQDTEIEAALEAMRQEGNHLSAVVDEYGATLGVVFLEDIIEVLVGEITDTTRKRVIPPRSEKQAK
ncbi:MULTISPECIES: hemolysin family protein [Glutamicibacter]|uniref:hemolysin family protein n=1 Tax=Glutamicibacter TaxID=1742989 RepID=UPI001957CECF|nr:hemolysin family protein [Glutamicibacter nicotianae]MBM7768088.1 CBS domain containing-hemolysin-like protein [Glutamicibacter nicotianae]